MSCESQEEGSESAGSTRGPDNEDDWGQTDWSNSSQVPRNGIPFSPICLLSMTNSFWLVKEVGGGGRGRKGKSSDD